MRLALSRHRQAPAPRLGLADHDLHVAPQRQQQPYQPRDTWLRNPPDLAGPGLGQPAAAYDPVYAGNELGLDQVLFGVGQAQVGEDVAGTPFNRDGFYGFRLSLSHIVPLDGPAPH